MVSDQPFNVASAVVRILDHVMVDGNGCWVCNANAGSLVGDRIHGTLYVRIYYGHKSETAHRLMWRAYHGKVPDGLWVLHKCDNPQCCNPKHLFLGTPRDNVHDSMTKGRRACQQIDSERMKELNKIGTILKDRLNKL